MKLVATVAAALLAVAPVAYAAPVPQAPLNEAAVVQQRDINETISAPISSLERRLELGSELMRSFSLPVRKKPDGVDVEPLFKYDPSVMPNPFSPTAHNKEAEFIPQFYVDSHRAPGATVEDRGNYFLMQRLRKQLDKQKGSQQLRKVPLPLPPRLVQSPPIAISLSSSSSPEASEFTRGPLTRSSSLSSISLTRKLTRSPPALDPLSSSSSISPVASELTRSPPPPRSSSTRKLTRSPPIPDSLSSTESL